MGILDLLAALTESQTDDDPDPGPTKPDQHRLTKTVTVYETTITYRNGETETLETNGENGRDEGNIYLQTGFKGPESLYGLGNKWTPSFKPATTKRSVALLGREPEHEPIATETWKLTYETIDDSTVGDSITLDRLSRESIDDADGPDRPANSPTNIES